MEDGDYSIRRWEDLDIDILVKIFQLLDIFELTAGIAHVCSAWRMACCDPLLWKTLDLSMLKSNFIKIPLEPFVYVDGRSDRKLTRLLKISLSLLSRQSIMTLIFHFNLYVSDEQLTYTAER
ncbi:F-box/LRR-repeat protein At3g48880-like [Arachis stenosperma]|uniref:F-box/LRR-repeat protein At3g48880-like n=1 Tax=Arachis stenosperma TaxID=217475 RepID=UPI0025AC5D8C|nr:F-box/LRR-repeat protein At3g48880-like [Arachis stenosperma]